MEKLTVTALKDIPANSFLYMDYAETEDTLFKQFPCSCGSDNCRGWISGRKERSQPPKNEDRARTRKQVSARFAEQVE